MGDPSKSQEEKMKKKLQPPSTKRMVTVKDVQAVKEAIENKKADKSLDEADDKGKASKSLEMAHARNYEATAE